MDDQPTQPAASTNTALATSSTTTSSFARPSSSLSICGSMSSAFLGVSSSSAARSQRRPSPSLYPPPALLLLPSRLASSGPAAFGGYSVAASSSQFSQISPSPMAAPARRPRCQSTHSLLSELSSIRRTGTNHFGDLNAQEMTQLQAQQTSYSTLQPLPGGFPSPASQMQMQSSSSNDVPLQPSRTFSYSGFEPPAPPPESQHLSTYLADLPGGSIFQSSPFPAGLASGSSDDTMHRHAQPSPDSELTPLPPSLHMPQYDLPQTTEPITGFVQSPSNSETYDLAPLPQSLQMPPPLFESSSQASDTSLPNIQPTNLQDSLQFGSSGSIACGAVEGSGQTSREAMPTPTSLHEHDNNSGGSGSSSTSISISRYSLSEREALQSLCDLLSLWSSTESSSSDQSMGSSVYGTCMPALVNKFDTMRSNIGYRRSSISPFSVGSSSHVPNQRYGGPPALVAGASSSMLRRGAQGEIFSEAELDRISKDSRLKDHVNTDPKRVRRVLSNRVHVARLKARKEKRRQDLERQAYALDMECKSLSTQMQLHQENLVNLKTVNRKMEIHLNGLNEQVNLKQVLNDQLASEIESLKLFELNMLYVNGIHNPMSSQTAGGSGSSANSALLHQQTMDSRMNDAINAFQHQAQEDTTQLQLEPQPHQAAADEVIIGQEQQAWMFG